MGMVSPRSRIGAHRTWAVRHWLCAMKTALEDTRRGYAAEALFVQAAAVLGTATTEIVFGKDHQGVASSIILLLIGAAAFIHVCIRLIGLRHQKAPMKLRLALACLTAGWGLACFRLVYHLVFTARS